VDSRLSVGSISARHQCSARRTVMSPQFRR
jgi:hypothetical protein